MSARHDAVIVGASIAGLYCGWKLARAGWNISIVDRRGEIGTPVRCGEATGNRAELARFVDIDEAWIAADLKGLAVQVNDSFSMSREIRDTGVLLHRDRFEQALAVHARNAGAEILLGEQVTALCGGPAQYEGVVGEKEGRIAGDLIIGADGCESMVGRWAGITRHLALHDAFTSLQYRVHSDRFNDGFLHFFIGSRIIPNGYIWVFPKEAGVVSVGAGLYGCAGVAVKARTFNAQTFLETFLASEFSGCTRSELITGCVPLAVCPRVLHRGNVVVVGDAARQCNPLTAGGIMNTLEAADLLVRHLLRGSPATAHERLGAYSRTWCAKPRREQKLFYMLKDVAATSEDSRIVALLSDAQKIFARPINRSRPFAWPVVPLLRLIGMMLPEVLKRWRMLVS